MRITVIASAEEAPAAIACLQAAFDADLRTMRHETAGAELTRTTLDAELRSPEITPQIANHVLAHFGAGGYHPGGHVRDLITMIARADPQRRRRLALAEPAYVLAVGTAQNGPEGIRLLQAIARGEPAAVS